MTIDGNYPTEETQALAYELVDLYARAGERLDAVIADGRLTPFQEFRYRELAAQVSSITKQLTDAISNKIVPIVSLSFAAGAEYSNKILVAAGLDVARVRMDAAINVSAVQAVAQQMVQDMRDGTAAMARETIRILRATQQNVITERAINQHIAGGIIAGETRRRTSAAIEQSLREAMRGATVVANGRHFKPAYYAQLVTRTRSREAATQGVIMNSIQYGITEFRWSFHAGACSQCTPHEGKIYSVVEGSGYPILTQDKKPPIHPNCRHVLVPYVSVDGESGQNNALL
jgi:hypothetical protein